MPWTHALDLQKASVKDGTTDVAISKASKFVPFETLEHIKLGDAVIREVRRLLPYGSGNQKFDVGSWTATQTDTQARGYLTQQLYQGNYGRAQHMAGAAVTFGSGTCQDQAAVAYLLLRERLPTTTTACFCYSDYSHHCYAAIGVPNTDPADQVVIVDPWPKYPQALLWTDHFCYAHCGIYRQKPGVGQVGKLARAQAKYNNVNPVHQAILSMYNHFGQPTWNHKWGNRKRGEVIVYHNDLITF